MMRLAIEQQTQRETAGRDLLSLDWSGLGKVVQLEALSLISCDFEEMARVAAADHEDLGDAA